MSKKSHDSPITKKLITELRQELDRRDLPIARMIELLNAQLEETRQFRTQAKKQQLYAWMNLNLTNWNPPNGEIALAMQKVLEVLKNNQ